MTKAEAIEWVYSQDEQIVLNRDDLIAAYVALYGSHPDADMVDGDVWSHCCNATPNCGVRPDVTAEPTVVIGEWGFTDQRGSGSIVCILSDRDAVQAAYDAIEEGDSSPEVLNGVIAAGGRFVAE